jgi:hypothetical protein
MLTEHEAWCAILDVLEGYGMPLHDNGSRVGGLCGVLFLMRLDEVIDSETRHQMETRLKAVMGPRKIYLGRPGQVAPRIPYVRRFIEETAP